MPDTQRLNYFKNEFLEAEDFQAEQKYHRDMRYLHTARLHRPGVVDGLQPSLTGNQVRVTPGMAVDADGHEIVVSADQLKDKPAGSFFVMLKFKETETQPETRGGVTGNKRIAEGFDMLVQATPDASAVVVGFFDAAGNLDPSRRQVATAVLGSNTVTGDMIADRAVGAAELADGAVTTAKIGDRQVTGAKLLRQQVWDITETVPPAPNNLIKSVFNYSASAPKFGVIFVQAYSTTTGANFEWKQVSTTDGQPPNQVVNQRIVFQNNSPTAISISYKIFVLYD